MQYVLTTHNLTKKVGKKILVSDLNMHVQKGGIYGFLGPNGAGKTTTMKMITNLWKPTSGEIVLFEQRLQPDSYEVFKRIQSIIEFPVFYEGLSAEANLRLHCEYLGYYRKNGVEEVLDVLSLSEDKSKKVKDFSMGMKQRLGIARAILTKPELLILDEPANGLDPEGIKQMRQLLVRLSRQYGISILLSSHILSEIQNMANTIGIIKKGKLCEEISMDTISELGMEYIELVTPDIKKASYLLSSEMNIQNFKIMEENRLRIYNTDIPTEQISALFGRNNIALKALHVKSESLEDYYLKVIGEGK